jgi:hypothetical protein
VAIQPSTGVDVAWQAVARLPRCAGRLHQARRGVQAGARGVIYRGLAPRVRAFQTQARPCAALPRRIDGMLPHRAVLRGLFLAVAC